jgi:hypothetical protein
LVTRCNWLEKVARDLYSQCNWRFDLRLTFWCIGVAFTPGCLDGWFMYRPCVIHEVIFFVRPYTNKLIN